MTFSYKLSVCILIFCQGGGSGKRRYLGGRGGQGGRGIFWDRSLPCENVHSAWHIYVFFVVFVVFFHFLCISYTVLYHLKVKVAMNTPAANAMVENTIKILKFDLEKNSYRREEVHHS